MPKQFDELTVEETADLLTRTPRRIRQLITAGTLEARYEGEGFRKNYYLKRSVVEELYEHWKHEPPRAGRPKGRKIRSAI